MLTRQRRNGNGKRVAGTRVPQKPKAPSMFDCIILDDGVGEEKPAPRSGHRIVADDGNIYCFGGYNPLGYGRQYRHGLFPEIWRFSLAKRRWHLIQSEGCPEETASHSMVLWRQSLLVWGGTGFPFGEKCSNTLHIYHIPTKQWHVVTCLGELPTARYGQSMTIKDGAIYVIGGTTGYNYNMKVHKLNLGSMFWEEPSAEFTQQETDRPPAPRYRHEIATSGQFIYVLGGGTALEVFSFEVIPAYNIESKQWTTFPSKSCKKTGKFPPSRKFHAAVQHGNYAYLCGGFDCTDMYKDIWRLDLSDLQWTRLSQELPKPIYFHSATVTPAGCMYVFGGVVSTAGDLRSNEIYKMWLNVPSLQEIAWDLISNRLNKTLPMDQEPDQEQLRRLNVSLPKKFWNRLM